MRKFLLLLLLVSPMVLFAEDHASCPYHSEHHKQVDQKGDQVMGFDHARTSHHFLLKPDGGVILADANDPKDQHTIEQIRMHFVEISRMFADGDFSKPFAIHGKVPPGADDMTKLKDSITYSFEKRENGGEVRISTQNADALKAIHTFLRFQIEEHRTGD